MNYRQKTLLFLLLIVFSTFFLSCAKLLENPRSGAAINIELKFHNESLNSRTNPGVSNSGTAPPLRLAKSARIIEAQVLALHCDGENDSLAVDASGYGNHARLYNVKHVERNPAENDQALLFSGASYAIVNSKPELAGTLGFQISLDIFLDDTAFGEMVLIDKHDYNGGYSLALLDGRLRLRVFNAGVDIRLLGRTRIEPKTWYSVSAAFNEEQLVLQVNGAEEASKSFTGPIPTSYAPVILGKSVADTIRTSDSFIGRMDEISIRTRTEYVDFDEIRIAVMDVSKAETPDSLEGSETHFFADYESEKWKFLELNRTPAWQNFRQIWASFFPIISDQKLVVKNGYAEGTVNGVDGLNLISVGAIKNNVLIYYGEGFVDAHSDKITTTEIQMYQMY